MSTAMERETGPVTRCPSEPLSGCRVRVPVPRWPPSGPLDVSARARDARRPAAVARHRRLVVLAFGGGEGSLEQRVAARPARPPVRPLTLSGPSRRGFRPRPRARGRARAAVAGRGPARAVELRWPAGVAARYGRRPYRPAAADGARAHRPRPAQLRRRRDRDRARRRLRRALDAVDRRTAARWPLPEASPQRVEDQLVGQAPGPRGAPANRARALDQRPPPRGRRTGPRTARSARSRPS